MRSEVRSLRIDNARLRDEAAIRALAAQPPAVPVEAEAAKTCNSYLQRALDAEADSLRLHNEKMEMYERAIAAEAKLAPVQSCSAANVDADLVERCRELLEWSATGLLNKGEGGALRAYAKRLEADVGEHYALTVAENNTKSEAMKALVGIGSGPQTLPDRASITRIINGIYGIGSGTYAGGHQDKSIARAVDAILAACSVTRPK